MAEEDTTSAEDVASVFKGASSGGGTAIKRPAQARHDADAQNAADAAAAVATGAPTTPDDARTAAEVFRPALTKTAFSALPKEGEQGGFWNTVKSVVGDVGLHVPGTSAPQPYEPRNPNQIVQETHTEAGLKRGVRDVTDTLRLTSTSDEEKKRFEEEHGDSNWSTVGRVIGQTAATAPLMSGAGALVGRAAGFVPGAVGRAAQWLTGATRAASTPGRAVQLAGQGAASGAAQAGLTSASSDQPLGEQLGLGAAVGGIAGPVIGAATKVADVARGYFPGIRQDVAELADRFRNATRTAANPAGVTVPAPQMSTNPTVRIMGDAFRTMPGAGTDAADLARQRGVQRAIADVAGLDADRFGTAEMQTMRNQIQADYRSALNQVGPIRGGAPLASDLANAATDASRFTDAATVGYVGRAVREVSDTFSSGPITPQAYRSLTNSDGPLAKIEKAAPQAAQPYLRAVRDAVEARMYASAPPDVAQQLKQLDARYRAMHTIRPLAAKATVGDIGLGGLQQQMINVSNKFDPKNASFAFTGGGRMGDIAQGSKQFFGHIPESGTAPRMQAYDFARNPQALLGLIPGIALGRPIQRYVRGPGFSGRMIDTSLGGQTPDVGRYIPYGLLGAIDSQRD